VSDVDVGVVSGLDATSLAPVARSTRSGVVECVHHGVGVVLAVDGSVSASVGSPGASIYPRSTLKPFQAAAMLEAGLELNSEQLAVACASHSGDEHHLAAVESILVRYGLDVGDLQNTPTFPFGASERRRARVAGLTPSSLMQNCSGKHAAMLATCRVNDWPIESYRDVDHPLQVRIRAETDRVIGRTGAVTHVGIDGCGAPTHVMSVVDVARGFAALARADSQVTRAMSDHPGLVGGAGRDVTMWMEAVPGLAAKDGAAGVIGMVTDDGRAAAVKIADGSNDARQAVTIQLLRMLDVDVDGALADTRDALTPVVRGHGDAVGSVVACAWS
jgi:L-asparaginase II